MTGVSERSALIDLAHAIEPGDARFGRLIDRVGAVDARDRIANDSTGLPNGDGVRLRLLASRSDAADDRAHSLGARIITRVDREWPRQFEDLGDEQPVALWVAGAADLRLLALRSLAIVGARACTAYGEETARSWAADLCSDGWSVVSGGAFGIDAAAHRGALAVGGVTVCVMAGGVDMPYPRAHDALIARIADEGLVLSESPPGESVRRQRFLSRNRLIAALSRATLVIEAAARSGTIATARAAAAMNRPVLAVPGPVTSAASAGCHRMIREGTAILVDSAADVAELLDFSGVQAAPDFPVDPRDRLTRAEKCVLDSLPIRASISTDAITVSSGLSPSAVWAALGVLEVGGWVTADSSGWRLARLTPTR